MGSITMIFTSENQLHPAAREVLLDAFEAGWADPSKLHHRSRHLAQLLDAALATFSTHLDIAPETLSFIGEPALGFHLGVNGFTERSRTYLPATSRQELFAATSNSSAEIISVDLDGSWSPPIGSPGDLLALSNINQETGALSPDISEFQGFVFVDATASALVGIPANWSTALWDSMSWRGPRGLGLFALRDQREWKNPIPHIDNRRVPESVNPALIIASAVALDATVADVKQKSQKIQALNLKIRDFISSHIGDVDIASPADAFSDRLSFSFLYIQAEQLVEEMEKRGFSVDSGSACISANLEPSHVLAAMGRLTHGNIRVRLYPELTDEQVDLFLYNLKESVEVQRLHQ